MQNKIKSSKYSEYEIKFDNSWMTLIISSILLMLLFVVFFPIWNPIVKENIMIDNNTKDI